MRLNRELNGDLKTQGIKEYGYNRLGSAWLVLISDFEGAVYMCVALANRNSFLCFPSCFQVIFKYGRLRPTIWCFLKLVLLPEIEYPVHLAAQSSILWSDYAPYKSLLFAQPIGNLVLGLRFLTPLAQLESLVEFQPARLVCLSFASTSSLGMRPSFPC